MSTEPKLPEPLSRYFAAYNVHDIEAMLSAFAPDATVRDEGEDLHGHASIGAWMTKTHRKYKATAIPTGVSQAGDMATVTAQVSGTFPGSPIELSYRFTISGGKIVKLGIA